MADLLPNISVTLNQVKATSGSRQVPINATVLLKAKSGPIGELTKISSYSEMVKIFGYGDATTPALYGIEQYLRTYNYVNIIRIASSSAEKSSVALKVEGEDPESQTALGTIISGESVYETDIYNGDTIKLVYNSARTRLSISGELNGTTYITPLELIDLSTATADVLEGVLNKLVANWNALNTGITLENKFINKTSSDNTLTPTDKVSGTVQLGDSGNDNTISTDSVVELLDLIEDPTVETQDVVMVPEFRNYTVVNKGTTLRNAYFYLVSATGTTLAEKQDAIANYVASDKGVMYIPDGCVMGDPNITVPFEVAALYAWATTYNVNRYYAPAGIKRGVLNLVSNVVNNLNDLDAEVLYNGDVPANPVKYLTNYGFTLYGQKTMDASQVFTNRINVSNLVNYIQIQGNIILQPYLFEYTPISTFQKVYLDLDKMLSNLATQEVLYDDYQIVCDTSNNTVETLTNHELHASLAVRPVNVTEYIYLDLTVTDKLGGE